MTVPPDDDTLDLLAAYALGALDPDEIARVGALLAERPELRATLAELRATADRLPYGLPEAAPPPELRQRVLDRAAGRSARQPPPAHAGLARRARGWIVTMAALTVVASVVAAIGWARLATMQSQLADLQTQVVAAQTQLDQLQGQIAAARQVLASLEGASGSGAILETSAGATIFAARLPPLQEGRVYQLWRIPAGGQPLSTGLFTVDPRGYAQLVLPTNQQPGAGDTVAVTSEPAGGSRGPTTDPLIVGVSGSA
jgi:anti-sigma-K factor RskA